MNKYISFVVPVYNVERYLGQCIESLIHQDISDNLYEIILVDDGSTDSSGKICEDYGRNYDNVICFHKKNGGLSDARNYGLDKAAGKYILFVDSDDYIADNILGRLIQQCKEQKEPQVFFLSAQKVFPDGTVKKYDEDIDIHILQGNRKAVIRYLAERDAYPASACLKMVSREFLRVHHICFKKGQLSEDYEWTLFVILKASAYGGCNDNYYFYRQNRSGSITNEVSEKHILNLFQIIRNMECLSREREYRDVSDDILKFAAYIYRCLLCSIYPYYKKYKKEVNKMEYLLNMKDSRDIKMIRTAARIVGIGNTIKLLNIYKMILRQRSH